MGSSGACRPPFLPAFGLKAFSWLFLGVFSTSLALAQVPIEPGAPAGDISQLPREITRTLDSVGLRNATNDERSPNRRLRRDGNCLLPPLTPSIAAPTVAADQLKIPEKASREYEQACSALRGRKLDDAEKHLRAAVREYAKYSPAWVTLGQLLVRRARPEEGKQACTQASQAEPGYAPAYLCLADIAARAHDWLEVLNLSGRALALGPSYGVVGYEYEAAANLNLHNLPDAEKSGLRAVELDRDHREPRVHFVLAQIYEAKGDRQKEAEQLREYLKHATDAGDITIVQDALRRLENHGATSPTPAAASARSAPRVPEIPRRSWAPADVDEEIPSAQLDVACPLEQVLKATSRRTRDLIESLQRFSADERIEEFDFDKSGRTRSTTTQLVNYVAQIEGVSSGFPRIKEYRLGNAANRESSVVDTGSAVFALIFHPSHIGSFDFRCEGMTHVQGSSAWQIHFEESASANQPFQAIRIGGSMYLPRLKGRAWIASDRYEVLRMETDLVSPIPQIDFNLEHLVISYAPVEFKSHSVRLWVPASTALYVAYRGHRYERVHSFNNFQLFSVDSDQAVKEPPVPPPVPWQLVSTQSKLIAEVNKR
jgi:tetratricopeptide (TPR) repeat protein